jgi:hypothetical protein
MVKSKINISLSMKLITHNLVMTSRCMDLFICDVGEITKFIITETNILENWYLNGQFITGVILYTCYTVMQDLRFLQ